MSIIQAAMDRKLDLTLDKFQFSTENCASSDKTGDIMGIFLKMLMYYRILDCNIFICLGQDLVSCLEENNVSLKKLLEAIISTKCKVSLTLEPDSQNKNSYPAESILYALREPSSVNNLVIKSPCNEYAKICLAKALLVNISALKVRTIDIGMIFTVAL